MTGHGAHHASLLRGVHGGATRRRRRKRRADEAFHLQILCMIWIIGVIVIESQFFYRSLNILDDVIVMDDPESRRRSMLNSMIEPLKPLPPEDYLTEDQKNRPPRPIGPPPRKEHLLPRKVITVVGPESSGTTFLASSLGVATGAFDENGGWVFVPPWAYSHHIDEDPDSGGRVHRKRRPQGRWMFQKNLNLRAISPESVEIQHLSLPWGWLCEDNVKINIVEALVPEDCFRYERDPHLHPKVAEKLWSSTRKGRGGNAAKMRASNETLSKIREADEHFGISLDESELMTRCRNEVKISSATDEWTCGAKCGFGQYEGMALYPQRFSLNISSHLEWYSSRGVEVHVVLSVRDPSISHLGKMKDHCHLDGPGQKEGQAAIDLMQEAILKGGTRGRVIVSSYEALMTFKEAYLFGLYRELGINSTFVPSFHGGNTKYIRRALGSHVSTDERLEPSGEHNSTPAEFVVPERLIVVVGTGSLFLANSVAVATGAVDELAGTHQDSTFLTSRDGKLAVQHLPLPVQGRMCNAGEGQEEAVQVLLPQVCGLNTTLAESCRDRLKVDVESVTYPNRFFVNLTSHLEFWLKLGAETSIVLVARDNDIVLKERLRDCPVEAIVQDDNERAISIMKEVYESQTLYAKQYPMRRNRLSDAEPQRSDRVIFAYYEGFMLLGEVYLFDLYRQLGISSSHAPKTFVDENAKYISDPASAKIANEGVSDASIRHKKGLTFAKKLADKKVTSTDI